MFWDFGDSLWILRTLVDFGDGGRVFGKLILKGIWRTVWDYFGKSLVDLVGSRLILKGTE